MYRMGLGQYGNWWCGPGMFFPGPLGAIVTLLFWGLILYLAFVLIRKIFSGPSTPASPAAGAGPLTTLKERYARGEISEEEYRRMKTELEQ